MYTIYSLFFSLVGEITLMMTIMSASFTPHLRAHLIFTTGSPTEPGAPRFGWTSWPACPRDPPASVFPEPGLPCTPPDLGVMRFELRSSGLYGKPFTGCTPSPALISNLVDLRKLRKACLHLGPEMTQLPFLWPTVSVPGFTDRWLCGRGSSSASFNGLSCLTNNDSASNHSRICFVVSSLPYESTRLFWNVVSC